MFSWYKYLIVSLFFSHLGFWSGSLFLIAPFPDLCLLVLFSDSTIVLTKSFLQSSTSLSNILHPTIIIIVCISSKTYTRSIDFQSKSESLTTENVLPFTDEVIAVLEHKYWQQLHFLALHLEILGYIPGLLNGLIYLRKIGDLSGDNLI